MNALNSPGRIVAFPSVQEVRDPHCRLRLRWAARNIDISSRKWPDYIADTLYSYKGTILLPDGRRWIPPLNLAEDLGCGRWFRHIFELNDDGNFRRSVKDEWRLMLILLVLRIDKPLIARHITR